MSSDNVSWKNKISHKLYYGWIIAAACAAMHFGTAGMTGLGFNLHAQSLRDGLGFTNTQLSLITTFRCLSSMATLPFVTRVYSLISTRLGMTITCLVLSLTYICFSVCSRPYQFYILAIVMGIAFVFGGTVPITMLLHKWFIDHRGGAASIALSGGGFCCILAPPVVAMLISSMGVSAAFRVEGIIMAAMALALFMILRDSPEQLGLKPYEERAEKKEALSSPSGEKRRRSKEIKGIWLILILASVFLNGCIGAPSSNVLPIHLGSSGFHVMLSATAVTVYGLALTAGKLSFGFLADRFGAYRVNYVFFGSWVLGLLGAAFLDNKAFLLLFAAVIVQGLGNSLTTVGIPVWIDNISTDRNYARNISLSQFIYSIGALLATPFPGIIADHTGSYSAAFIIFGTLAFISCISIQIVYHRNRL